MSKYYQAQRTKNLYVPGSPEPYPISRVKIDLFLRCPLCFWLDRRKGVGQPPGYPFNINSAIDEMVKREFDFYREIGIPHPLMIKAGLRLIPFKHPKMEEWRDSRTRGIRVFHKPTNFSVFGGVDDIWYEPVSHCQYIVDTKATAQLDEVSIDKSHHIWYKRQVEVYTQLQRWNGFEVSDTAYFLYYNGIFRSRNDFLGRMDFDAKIIPYKGDSSWVEPTLFEIKNVLESSRAPNRSDDCDYCSYREAVAEAMGWKESEVR